VRFTGSGCKGGIRGAPELVSSSFQAQGRHSVRSGDVDVVKNLAGSLYRMVEHCEGRGRDASSHIN
jgi:hypothetical protein